MNPKPRIISKRTGPLTGTVSVPGDKSITHRALFFGALHAGVTQLRNPSPALDCQRTFHSLRSLGYHLVEEHERWIINGVAKDVHGSPLELDCGNSGTTARLLTGFLTGESGEFLLTGDESLSRRPMERVADPLRKMGADIRTREGAFPVTLCATERVNGIDGRSGNPIEVKSAQVHAALVLAGLRSQHGVVLQRIKAMRDHTLRMAGLFGYPINTTETTDRIFPIDSIATGSNEYPPIDLEVPGDVSSAAFLVAAALLVPESVLIIEKVGLNPTRISFLEALRAMGANVEWQVDSDSWEPVGTIRARYTSDLQSIVLDQGSQCSVDQMMDELPLLALLATQAQGETVLRGAGELRVKESDRITATACLLQSLGVEIRELEDGFCVKGRQIIRGGATANHHGDHRLAMLAGVAGLIAEEPIVVPESEVAAISWPDVWKYFVA